MFPTLETSRHFLSSESGKRPNENANIIQVTLHPVTLTYPASYQHGRNDRKAGSSNHDPRLEVKCPDDISDGREFARRFRDPSHGRHCDWVGVVHQAVPLCGVGDP